MARVVQISDTHFGSSKDHFDRNVEPLRKWLADLDADLIVHTGDVTLDGAGGDEDMAHSAALLGELGREILMVPGNHDVGDAGFIPQPLNEERLDRWRKHLGDDRWVRDVAGWRLIGLNALVMGSDLEVERDQMRWLEDTMASAQGRQIAWFLHRPLFIGDPDEGDLGYWSVKPVPRKALFDLAARFGVRLVSSGHLHKAHDETRGDIRFIWGPSAAFVVGRKLQPEMAGEARLGAVVFEFEEDRFDAEIVDIPGLEPILLDDIVHEVYPSH